jgi:hypothetical protein
MTALGRFYGWRRWVPALLRGVDYNDRGHPAYYRRWPLGIRWAWPRYAWRSGFHGVQCGGRIIRSTQGPYVTSARVYRSILRVGPVLITFGPDHSRLEGHPEDIAEWVWERRKGELIGLLNTHVYKDHIDPKTVRRDLRRVMEEMRP